MLFEPCTVLGLEIVGAAGDVGALSVPHIFARHTHTVDQRIVKMQTDRGFNGVRQRFCGVSDRFQTAVVRSHAALEVDFDKVRTAVLEKIMELQIELIHASGCG